MSEDSACGRMPPMMLLPLIDRAVTRGFDSSRSARTLRISSDLAAGRLRVVIADSTSGFSASDCGDDISSIRERLTALYGGQAQLQFVHEHGASAQTIIELPFEAVEDGGNGVGPGVALRDEHIS
jgi:LytS/YehU family sensor histidine kinase